MVVIRLSRGGTNKRPFYSIIVTDKRKPRDSGHIERLGFYNPIAKGGETELKLDTARLEHWLKCGAQPSPRVLHLIEMHKTIGTTDEGVNKNKVKKTKKASTKAAAAELTPEAKAEENLEETITHPESAEDALNPETEV